MRAAALFDTNRFVKRLAAAGFELPLSVTLADVLRETVTPAVRAVSAASVTRADTEREIGRHVLETEKDVNDVAVRQAQSLHARKLAAEEALRELRTLRHRTRESLASIRSERRLELCAERARQRDDALATALRYQELHAAIDAERGAARAALGKLRHDMLYSLTGFFFTAAAALFGFLRLYAK